MTFVVTIPTGNWPADALAALSSLLPRVRGQHEVVLMLEGRKINLGGGLRVSNTPLARAILSEWGDVSLVEIVKSPGDPED